MAEMTRDQKIAKLGKIITDRKEVMLGLEKVTKDSPEYWGIDCGYQYVERRYGKDVADDQIKVYAAETVEGLESAAPMSEGVTVTDRKSAVKVSLEVETPPGDGSRFFRVGFGE